MEHGAVAPSAAAGSEPCAARPPERCLDPDTALAFADGQLAVAERVDVEQRIDACTRCRGIVAEAARSRDDVETAPGSTEEVVLLDQRIKRADPQTSALAPGERVGRFVVERALGAGGMGFVSLARDPELRRQVVIKLVRVDVWGDESRDELEARLTREAQAMAQLSHPNVVQIFDIGRIGERVFLAMEYVPGETLDNWLGRDHTGDEVLAMMLQAGAGLEAAHRAGLVHRDFKPANVLVNSDNVAKVTDFGLARVPKASAAGITRQLRTPNIAQSGSAPDPYAKTVASAPMTAMLTAANAIIGTPAYMAPEQAEGCTVDARSDQFAFALVLLDALVKQSPVRRAVAPGQPHAIDDALGVVGVPPRVRAAIVRGLDDDPDARFPSMTELLRELAPEKKRRALWWPAIAGVIAAGGIGAAVWFVMQRGSSDGGDQCTSSIARAWPDSRAKLLARYEESPRPFATWTGASVAGEIDRAVDRLAAAEVAKCRGKPVVDDACFARRKKALDSVGKITAGDDPWSLVRAIDECEPRAQPPAVAKIRAEIQSSVDARRATEIGDAARALGELRLAADAYEAGAHAALAADDIVAAERLLLAMLAAGESASDDAVRGRALLFLLDVARWKGDAAAANRDDNALQSILARQQPDSRTELAIATHEAEAWGVIGDSERTDAAWERALSAARALHADDDELRVLAGRAWSRHASHFDLSRARDDVAAAISAVPNAGALARAHALTIEGDLALAAGDGESAREAFAAAVKLEPERAKNPIDKIRAARALGLVDVAGGQAALAKIDGGPATKQRVELARAWILRAAGRAREAAEALMFSMSARPLAVSAIEQVEMLVERCAADVDRGNRVLCMSSDLVKPFHPMAPARARLDLVRMRAARLTETVYGMREELEQLIKILVTNGATMVQIAEVHFELAQAVDDKGDRKKSEHAITAREIYAKAGRTEQVAEVDRWMDGTPKDDAGAGDENDADAWGSDGLHRRGPMP